MKVTVFVETSLPVVENERLRLVLSSVSEALVLQIRNDNTSQTDRPPPWLPSVKRTISREPRSGAHSPRLRQARVNAAREQRAQFKRSGALCGCAVACSSGVTQLGRSRPADRPAVA